jgi:hypothetical protein
MSCLPIASRPSVRSGGGSLAMNCGSSWEVDLRADVDCDKPGLERCHPRYTLGWQHREVQLHRDGLSPPSGVEYVHAYCDVWQRGRLEQVLSRPVARKEVEDRTAKLALKKVSSSSGSSGAGSAVGSGGEGGSGPERANVIVLIVRGLSLDDAHARMPLTMRTMTRLRRSGRFRGASYRHFVPASESGEATMQSLLYGTAERPMPRWAASRSIWHAYRRWGYVTAFGEAGCETGASRAASYRLDDNLHRAIDHVAVEPSCGLDTQLRATWTERPSRWPPRCPRRARVSKHRTPCEPKEDHPLISWLGYSGGMSLLWLLEQPQLWRSLQGLGVRRPGAMVLRAPQLQCAHKWRLLQPALCPVSASGGGER